MKAISFLISYVMFFMIISFSVCAQQFQVSDDGRVSKIIPARDEMVEEVKPRDLLERHNRLNVEIESRESALRELMSERDQLNSVLENPNVQKVLNPPTNSEQVNGEVENP